MTVVEVDTEDDALPSELFVGPAPDFPIRTSSVAESFSFVKCIDDFHIFS